MRVSSGPPRRAVQGRLRLAFVVALVGCGQAFAYTAARRGAAHRSRPATWVGATVSALVLGRLAMAMLDRPTDAGEKPAAEAPSPAEQAMQGVLADRAEQQRCLRHDLRGVLSPILLVADRLLGHDDPKVRRSGEIMVRTVERATALLADPA